MSRQPSLGTHDCGGDAAAYVLGALDTHELEAFRRHLDTCAFCREEIATLQQAADALPMAAVQLEVPRSLRRRVLGEIKSDARANERARRRRAAGNGWSLALPRPALAAGVVGALAAATFGGVEIASTGGSGAAHVFAASVGNAALRVTAGHAELSVHQLEPLPASRTYEVWLKRPNETPAPAHALFNVTSAGDGDVDVPGSLHGVSEVLVTQEPAAGSPRPTTAPVVVDSIS
jgi:anti-sigma-K factor RskA